MPDFRERKSSAKPGYPPVDNSHPASPSVETKLPQAIKPLVCTWNGLDRLITKCDRPEPNADGTGWATCGAVKTDAWVVD